MSIAIHAHTGGRVPGAGFYAMPAALYHADPAPEPSLSASIAVRLLCESPRHAWWHHPRLRPEWEAAEVTDAMRRGSVAHELILGAGAGFETHDYDDWRKKDAQAAKAASIEAGVTPILIKDFVKAEAQAAEVRAALASAGCGDFFDPEARSELVMVWQDMDGVWCRAMLDKLTWRGVAYDLKTTARGLAERTLQNRFYDGFALQPGLYLRGLNKLWPEMAGRFTWRWIFAEQDEPFCTRIMEAGHAALGLGGSQAEAAVRLWRDCLRADAWPGYPPRVEALDPTDFAFNQWFERQERPSFNAPLAMQAAE